MIVMDLASNSDIESVLQALRAQLPDAVAEVEAAEHAVRASVGDTSGTAIVEGLVAASLQSDLAEEGNGDSPHTVVLNAHRQAGERFWELQETIATYERELYVRRRAVMGRSHRAHRQGNRHE